MMITNTVSLSWRIGRAIALARRQSNIGHVGRIIVDAVGGGGSAKVLFAGKITDVRRRYVSCHSLLHGCTFYGVLRLYKGHTIGEVVITALPPDEDYPPPGSTDEFTGKLIIPFKNENLYAEHTSEHGQKTASICHFLCGIALTKPLHILPDKSGRP